MGGHLTGSVTCDPDVTIDGYDISLLGSEVVDAREGTELLKENLARKGAFRESGNNASKYFPISGTRREEAAHYHRDGFPHLKFALD